MSGAGETLALCRMDSDLACRSPFLATYTLERGLVRRFDVQEAACFGITFDVMAGGGLGLAAVSHCTNSTAVADGIVFCHRNLHSCFVRSLYIITMIRSSI